MSRGWLALFAGACMDPSQGTFVGNPGNLTAAPAGTAGVSLSDGSARVESIELVDCAGSAVGLTPPEERIGLRWDRSDTGIQIPPGQWCGLELHLTDLRLDLLGARPVVFAAGSIRVSLRGELTLDDDDRVSLVLGHNGWVAPALDLAPREDGVIHVADDDEAQAALEAALQGASGLFAPGGAAFVGDAFDTLNPEPETCELEPLAVAPVILDCAVGQGYAVSTFAAENTCETQLWVAGVYETHGNHSGGVHPMGYATVEFALPGSNVLALSSYEPVTWQVELAPGAGLDRILVAGYHAQVVVGAPGVPVEFVPGPACGYEVPGDPLQGCTGSALIDAFARAAGTPVTRFDGCYQATRFRWEAL